MADHNLPGFSGLEALRMVTASALDVPLVLVSGAIDVPTALEVMKAGAKDFVLKNDTQRLPSVVERELAESAQRRRRRRAEAQRDQALLELQEANIQLREFVTLTDVPLYSTPVSEVLTAVLERLTEILDANGAALFSLDEQTLVAQGAVDAPHLDQDRFRWAPASWVPWLPKTARCIFTTLVRMGSRLTHRCWAAASDRALAFRCTRPGM